MSSDQRCSFLICDRNKHWTDMSTAGVLRELRRGSPIVKVVTERFQGEIYGEQRIRDGAELQQEVAIVRPATITR